MPGCTGAIVSVGSSYTERSAATAAGFLVLAAATFAVEAFLEAAAFLDVDFFVVVAVEATLSTGNVRIFSALGVGVLVHCHAPLINAHVSPSSAVS